MKGAIALRKPLSTTQVNTASTNITTSSWTTLVAAISKSASSMEVFNQSGSLIQLAVGAAGHEVAIPYTIPSGGSNIMIPIEIGAGQRISAKAIDAAQTAGWLVINCFG